MNKEKQRLFEVMGHVNPEFKRINESNEQLTNQDQQVLTMLLGNNVEEGLMNEGVNWRDFVPKFKNALGKGLITAALLTSLLSSNAFSQEQKQQIQNLAQTEQSVQTDRTDSDYDPMTLQHLKKRANEIDPNEKDNLIKTIKLLNYSDDFKDNMHYMWKKYQQENMSQERRQSSNPMDKVVKSPERVGNEDIIDYLWNEAGGGDSTKQESIRKFIRHQTKVKEIYLR